ncbi:MAG: fused MFS/spermidine synthase, partial [Boseongicola sp.]
ASNLGSLIALLAFPLIAEPFLGASAIASGFAMGFVALGVGLFASGVLASRGNVKTSVTADSSPIQKLSISTMAFWAVLAFLPSSLMLSVTSKISTDIGALPLVWVIPLAIYLLTFVLTFSNRTKCKGKWLEMAALLAATFAISLFLGVRGVHLGPVDIGLLTGAFFLMTLWAHRTLYEARPDAENLTIFYVVMSIGGALGGLFNSILAPWLFSGLFEGPITIGLFFIILLRSRLDFRPKPLLLALGAGLLLAGCLAVLMPRLAQDATSIRMAAIALPSALLLFAFRPNLSAAALGIAVMIAIPALVAPDGHHFRDRSFFGLHRVLDKNGARFYSNGTTVHGAQALTEYGEGRPTPSSYYHPAGPMGQIMQSDIGARAESIGVIGLGVGSLACYARPDQNWHFYEIDKMVDQVARNPELFTFLTRCTPSAPTHLGDARVVLASQADMNFDVLVVDAYSSDAVPMHLTTLEAVAMYRERLSSDGILIFHISNRYYDLVPPLARIADALGFAAHAQTQTFSASDDPGFRPSIVLTMTGTDARIPEFKDDPRWVAVSADGGRVWTDDRANPLSALKSNPLYRFRELFGG